MAAWNGDESLTQEIKKTLDGYGPDAKAKIQSIATTLAIKQTAREVAFSDDNKLVLEAIKIYDGIVIRFFK